MGWKFNPFTGTLDNTGSSGSSYWSLNGSDLEPTGAYNVDLVAGNFYKIDDTPVLEAYRRNVFVGNSGNSGVSGILNYGMGENCLDNITVGLRNNAWGYKALEDCTSGSRNNAMGVTTLANLTDGEENCAVGNQALSGVGVNPNRSVAIGYQAGLNAGGDDNVFIGRQAGYFESGDHKLYIANNNSTEPLIYGEFDNQYISINSTNGECPLYVIGDLGEFRISQREDDNTIKQARYTFNHYDIDEEPCALLVAQSTSTENSINYGGGSSLTNAATSIGFYTAANNTTTTGTARMIVDGSDGIYMGLNSTNIGVGFFLGDSLPAPLSIADDTELTLGDSGDATIVFNSADAELCFDRGLAGTSVCLGSNYEIHRTTSFSFKPLGSGVTWQNFSYGAAADLNFLCSQGTEGAETSIVNGARLHSTYVKGYHENGGGPGGGAYYIGGEQRYTVDGAIGASAEIPTRWELLLTEDGSSSPREVLEVDNAGDMTLQEGNMFFNPTGTATGVNFGQDSYGFTLQASRWKDFVGPAITTTARIVNAEPVGTSDNTGNLSLYFGNVVDGEDLRFTINRDSMVFVPDLTGGNTFTFGSSINSTGKGTDVTFLGGTPVSGNNNGGDIIIIPGQPSGTGSSGKVIIGEGLAGVDYEMVFDGESNDGTFTYYEDEDYLDWDKNMCIGSENGAYTRGVVDIHGTEFPAARYINHTTGNNSGAFNSLSGISSTNYLVRETDGTMGDGFGQGLVFGLRDSASGGEDRNYVSRIYTRRDGANNAGRLQFWVGAEGLTPAMDIKADGDTFVRNGLQVGLDASTTDFPRAQSISSQDNSSQTETANIGLVGEAVADSSLKGYGLYGGVEATGIQQAAGVYGEGTVSGTSVSGITTGVWGVSEGAHNGNNIAIRADASNSGAGVAYVFFGSGGGDFLLTDGGNFNMTGGGTLTCSGNISTQERFDNSVNRYSSTDTINDEGIHICDSASAITLTIPDGTQDGEEITIINKGAGTVTLSGSISTTTATTVLYTGELIRLIWDNTDSEWI